MGRTASAGKTGFWCEAAGTKSANFEYEQNGATTCSHQRPEVPRVLADVGEVVHVGVREDAEEAAVQGLDGGPPPPPRRTPRLTHARKHAPERHTPRRTGGARAPTAHERESGLHATCVRAR